MKLIKLNSEHYIIVDDSEIKEGDYYLRYNQSIMKCTSIKLQFNEALNKEETIICSDGCGDPYERSKHFLKKITHSTQPLEFEDVKVFDKEWKEGYFDKIQPLNLSEVKELLGEVDVEKKADKMFPNPYVVIEGLDIAPAYREGYILGYNQALEDNKDKKYTEEDMFRMLCLGNKLEKTNFDDENFSVFFNMFKKHIQSLQPKTEWEVEFIDGKLKLK